MATENAWCGTCQSCGMRFSNRYEFGPHVRECGSKCGYCGSDSDSYSDTATSAPEFTDEDSSEEAANVTSTPISAGLWDLTRRPKGETDWGVCTNTNAAYPNMRVQGAFVADFCPMQITYDTYVRAVYDLCDPSFWRIFSTLHNVSSATVCNVLGATRKVLKARAPGVKVGHRFPSSRRTLNRRIHKKADMFWDNVSESHSIDLQQYNLPKVKKVEFTFINPIWVFIRRCEMLTKAGCELVFQPQVLQHPTSAQPTYGGGIQFGLLLRAAAQSVPAGALVALLNLSWDGASPGFGSRSSSPIQLQVMNTNSGKVEGVGFLGYLPKIECGEAAKDSSDFEQAEFYLLQTCVGKVLAAIEKYATHGFSAFIGGEKKVLFPRLGAVTLDTPEKVKYFGLRSLRSCSYCRLRNGRSVARHAATQHDPVDVLNKFQLARAPEHTRAGISSRARARHSLFRQGFKWKFMCKLNYFANRCLVSIPSLPPRLFGGVCQFERMHTFFINYCNYATDLLEECVIPGNLNRVRQRVTQCHNFRHPRTGKHHFRLQTLIKMPHKTAERRVMSIFYWAHAMGPEADIIAEDVRLNALATVSTLQLLLVSTRGHRSYTRDEWDEIFTQVGQQFFANLETMAEYVEVKRMSRPLAAGARPRVPFRRMQR